MRFFSYDSKFGQVMVALTYGTVLNLLWVVCSLPVFTIGASTTALYYAALKMAKGEESYPARMFFRAFKENFRQATALWLILLSIGCLLAADGYILYHLRLSTAGTFAIFWTLLLAVVIAAAVVYVIILTYVFPLTASVTNTTFNLLKNSLLIGVRYLFCTITVFGIHFIMFFLVVQQLENQLTTGFVVSMDANPDKYTVYTYSDLFLSSDPSSEEHQYAYASRMKLLATIQNQTLDVVLMNREAYDILSANGYLLSLPDLLSPEVGSAADLAPYLMDNTVILEDNQIEFDLGTADEYWAQTQQVVNGLDVSGFRMFTEAGYSDELYLSVIGNTARPEMVRHYIGYLNMDQQY